MARKLGGGFNRGRSLRVEIGPLRKIVAEEGSSELLECGHRQRRKHDIFGPTNAYRRRCRQCRREEVVGE